tara:strand:+ start:4030 stop:5523 length:1494 start_codon:yes stop_codon:yes gene_type:complete
MTKKHEKEYLIKNINCFSNLLTFDINKNKFLLKSELDINKSLTNNLICKFQIKHIRDKHYELKFKNIYLANRINIFLIFSSDKLNNPLFFNIILKDKNEFKLLNISNINFGKDFIECARNENLYFDKIEEKDINKIKFNSDPKYIFYFSNINHELCKIKINNNDYSVYGFNKSPVINKNNINKDENYCYYNPDLINSWRVDLLKNPLCKHIKLKKNNSDKVLKVLEKCSSNGGPYRLLRELPNEKKVIGLYKKELYEYHAGQTKLTIDEKNKSIQDKIGNDEIKKELDSMNDKLDANSKVELANVLTNFNNYLEQGNFSNISEARGNFSKVLQTIKDRHDEYQLAGKYKICKGNLISELNDVSNVIDCQSHCNANDECRNMSYNRLDKKCNLYKNCKLMRDDNYNSYTKKSLLKESGYNIYQTYYKNMEPTIDNMPAFLKFLYYIAAIIIVICLSILLYRFLKIFVKIFMCVYYGSCYIPKELLDISSNGILEKRYI